MRAAAMPCSRSTATGGAAGTSIALRAAAIASTHPFTRSVRDVHYTHRALERCRTRIGEADPAARPDCALYAIRNKIVWQGPLPWEGDRAPAATAKGGAAVGASADMIGVHVARDMLEFWRWGGMFP